MTDDEDPGKGGPASGEDLTAADIELIHALVDDLSEEERAQLGREAEAGGGPLTERLNAAVMRAMSNRMRSQKAAPTSG